VDAWQWNPDLIWFDNLRIAPSINYYVQQLYSYNKGTNVLPITRNGATLAGEDQLYASAVVDTEKKEIIVKLANTADTDRNIRIKIENLDKKTSLSKTVKATILTGDLRDENTLDHPKHVLPKEYQLELDGNVLTLDVKKQSFNVYNINY